MPMKQLDIPISQRSETEKIEYRDRIEILYNRVSLLNGEDKLLMTMYLRQGNTFRQLARLAGVSETTISRRIRKIMKRLINSAYITCLRNRDKFTRDELEFAREYFLMGMAMRKIAKKHRITYYQLRKTIRKIEQSVKENGGNSQHIFHTGEQDITSDEI